MIERQELYCHECGRYVQFNIDTALNGNHVLECPNCGHEHCRVVDNGKITDVRWDRRNNNILPAYRIPQNSTSSTLISTFDTSSSNSTGNFLYNSWMNTATGRRTSVTFA